MVDIGSACGADGEKLEFLLELGEGGSKKEIHADLKDAVKTIEGEIKQHFQLTDVVLDGLSSTSSRVNDDTTCWVLQRWSTKWSEYVDVITIKAVEDQDKLRVVLKTSIIVIKLEFERV